MVAYINFIGNIRTKPVNPMAIVSSVSNFLNARQLKLEKVKIDFIQASSYGADNVSSENIVLKKDIDVDIL